MENTIENSKKFFGNYYEQPDIMYWPTCEIMMPVNDLDEVCGGEYLELTPLSKITIDDAEEYGVNPLYEKFNALNLSLIEVDGLRSKGYALPWMGLLVETLIEYGWVKLK